MTRLFDKGHFDDG